MPILAVLVLADGWVSAIPAQPLPPDVPNPAALAGRTVLDLPAGDYPDIAAQYRAVRGGWRAVNGYSGFLPPYYPIVVNASREDVPGILDSFLAVRRHRRRRGARCGRSAGRRCGASLA